MAIPSFFKQTKPRGFNYTPRYYDPVKEELEQRRREWQREREARHRETGAETAEGEASAATGEETGQPSANIIAGSTTSQPYRSKIMRGDMRTHFHRRQEKVRKQTTIRLLVIILIIVLFVYFYLRF